MKRCALCVTVCRVLVGAQGLSLASLAAASDYTRCRVPQSTYADNAGDYCIPPTNADTPARGRSFTVAPAAGQEDSPVVLALPARNCRTATGAYSADVAVVLDSSQSLEKTDPDDRRMEATDAFLSSLKSLQPSLSVGVVSYGGRLRFADATPVQYLPGTETEAPTPKYKNEPCADGDDAAELTRLFSNNGRRTGFSLPFPSDDAKQRWNEKASASDTYPLSICEFLRRVNTQSANEVDEHAQFLRLPKGSPRGATDVSYMLETAVDKGLLGDSASRTKRVIVITDGLPNIPKRRPEAYCRSKDYLPKDELATDPNSPTPDARYCDDRNFREGVTSAHATAQGDAFSDVNVHHVLYWSEPDQSFIDFDDEGTLNPADFLMENSARTGNGKVKFTFAEGPEALQQALSGLVSEFDEASLQRVDIRVTNAKGEVNSYSAVSPSGFFNPGENNPQDKRFDLKILYLTTGNNSVLVTYVYGDSVVTETLTVNVLPSGSPQAPLECTEASSSFTIDGDRKDYPVCLARDPRDKLPDPPTECTGDNQPAECQCKAPGGDGFLPFPDAEGRIRVYRNADAANKQFENEEQFARAQDYGARKGDPRASDLRIQGGTGNCGVVGGLAPQAERLSAWLSLLLLGVPLLAAFAFGRSPLRPLRTQGVPATTAAISRTRSAVWQRVFKRFRPR